MHAPSVIYAFGEFELDEALLELRLQGRAQLVPPRVLKAMLHLVRHRTRAVSRDELAEVVWGGLAVSDGALSQAIMLARKITQDEGDQQRVIRTVRGHGFRFVAQVIEREPGAVLAPPTASVAPAPPASLFGRDRELAELLGLLARAEQGQGSLVFLEGEPGIGKTSLVDQLCLRASEHGAQVFWGRCWEEGGAPAFWPFIQVLRAMVVRFGADALRSWLDGDELLALVPELAQKPLARAAASLMPLGSAQERFRVFDGMGRLFRRMAHALRDASNGAGPAGRVLLIALEDLHAADDASLQLLRFLTPDLRDAPLFVVGTFRDLEVTPEGPLAALLGGPLENSERFALGRLARSDVALLAERLAGQALTATTIELLHRLSGGNPFLVTELTRCSEQELQRSALSVLRMPERVARAVRRRTDGLPEATRTALEVAAVVGREVALATLTAVLDCTDQTLLTALEPALQAGVLESAANGGGRRVRFPHALVRDTLYMELPLSRRVSLHRRVGETLEASHDPERLLLYELAHHFYLAVPEGGAPKAIDYALRAASQAEQVFAFDSAAALRDRAIDLSSPPPAGATLYELLLSAGSAWYRAGELDKACARFHRAAEHARADGTRLAIAVMSYARVRRGLAVYDGQFLALVGPALAALGPGDNVFKAMLLGYRSLSLDSFGPVAERDAATLEAVEMARRLKNDQALMGALMLRRWLMACALHPAQTYAIATELLELGRAAGRREPLLDGLFWRIQDCLELGEIARAERDLEEYAALAESRRHMAHRYWALLLTAAQRTWRGKLAQAAEAVERARSLGQRIREPTAIALHAVQVWSIRLLQGAAAEAPEGLELVFPGVAASFAGRAFRLQIFVVQGRHAEARRLYDALAESDFADVPADPFRRSVLACLSAGCVAFDDAARAARLYALLLPDADLNVIVNFAWAFSGPVSRFLARLALCMRDYERAALHFECALEQCAQCGARPLLATLQYEYAHTLDRIPGARPGHAAQLLAAASQAAQELGIARSWPLPPALARTIDEDES